MGKLLGNKWSVNRTDHNKPCWCLPLPSQQPSFLLLPTVLETVTSCYSWSEVSLSACGEGWSVRRLGALGSSSQMVKTLEDRYPAFLAVSGMSVRCDLCPHPEVFCGCSHCGYSGSCLLTSSMDFLPSPESPRGSLPVLPGIIAQMNLWLSLYFWCNPT